MKHRNNDSAAFRLLSLVLAITLPGSALAQEDGWYGGFNAGRASTDMGAGRALALSSLQDGAPGTSRFSSDAKDTAVKVLGGYSFNGYFALEGSWFDLGEFSFDASQSPSGTLQGKASIKGLALDLVGTIPLRGKISAFARVGINSARIDQDLDLSGTGSRIADRSDGNGNETYGIGLQYAFNEAFSLRAELARYRLDDNRVTDDFTDTLTLGIVYRFGNP